ncbi:hypothetical protein ACFSUD_12335 [Sulfitobacter aestuarii]|uniref:Uncharacterized protein n=1 Tax=Sulfitobacter aestuarii TaxID=2161676 RepID=A0ABW5U560_9RHOB
MNQRIAEQKHPDAAPSKARNHAAQLRQGDLPDAPLSWLATGAVVVAICLKILAVQLLPLTLQETLLAEGGLYETLSVLLYLVAVIALLALFPLRQVAQRWYLPVLLLLFAARELDLDKAPFTLGLLKARQYSSDAVPMGEKIIAAILLIAILGTLIVTLRRETGALLKALMRGSAAAMAIVIGLFLGIAAKTFDGLARKLSPFGIDLSEGFNHTIYVIEEIGELGIPLMFLTAILLLAQRARHRNQPPQRADEI